MMNATYLRKNNYKVNFNKPNLINSSISSLSSESKSNLGDRIKINTRKKIPNKKPEIIKIKNLINLNTEEFISKKRTLNISCKKKENPFSNNYNNNNNLFLNLSANKNKKKEPFNNNNLLSYRNLNFKRKNYLNEIDFCARPLNVYSAKNNNANSINSNNNIINTKSKNHNYRERITTEQNNLHNNNALISQSEIDKTNLDEITKLSNLLLEKEMIISDKDSIIKNLEKENTFLKEKLKKYKNIIRSYDENFNFSFVSNINQESDLHNLNINIENNDNHSGILTEQTLIELKNDFNDEYTDEISDENRLQINRFSNFRFLSDRLDDTENLNEINICENYFVDRSIINIHNQNNSENIVDNVPNNIIEITNHDSPMTTLTNFHNFSERTINIEEMTYEELIDLQDRIGYANKGLSVEDIKKIKAVPYNKHKRNNSKQPSIKEKINNFSISDSNKNIIINENVDSIEIQEKCTICQYDFIENELIKELGCDHKFHLECLDTWLSQRKNCPNCNEEINTISIIENHEIHRFDVQA